MKTDCRNCPLRQLEAFVPMSASDIDFMRKFKMGEMAVEAGTPILSEGANAPQIYTVLSGMGLRAKLTECGRRQVINFVFPGDFLGLQAGIMGEMTHSVEASTEMTLCVFDRKAIWQVFREQPERAFDLTWLAAIEEHFLGETLLTLGQRDALQSVAWALHRIGRRGLGLGLMEAGSMPLPYRQQDLADALGLSLVHTNKTLGKLRDRQLATWAEGVLRIHDAAGLARVAMVENVAPMRRPLI
ncbi:Crp/Fnr family transcriptional regulator [Tropicimonas sediminicola]|nr:Crp/Fnr family transcriptional regulator [Tropicimonas sediminicola]